MKASGTQASGKQANGARATSIRSTTTTRTATPSARDPTGLLELQRVVGNRAVRSLLSAPGVVQQRAIPGASARKPSPLPQPPRAVPAPAHRVRPAGQTVSASVSQVLASPGRPLDPAQQQDMQRRFGHDFSRVRVHADAAAEQSAWDVNANAYTVGRHMVFAPGKYAPHTSDGKRLLAHELVHTLQQRDAPAALPGPLRVSAPNDSHEVEADSIARGLSRDAAVDPRAPVRVTPTGPQVAREPAPDVLRSVLQMTLDRVRNLLMWSEKERTLIGLVNDGVVIEIKIQNGSSRLFGVSNPWAIDRDERFGHVPTTTMYRDTNSWVIDYLGEGPGTNVVGPRIVLNAAQTAGEMALALYLEGQKRAWRKWDSMALEASVEREDYAQARADYVKAMVNDVVQRNVAQIDVKDELKKWGAKFTAPLLLEDEYGGAFTQGLHEETMKGRVLTGYSAGRAAGARVFEDALKSGRLLTHTGDKYADYYGKEWDKRKAEWDKQHEEWVRQHPEVVKQQQFEAGIKALVELVNRTDPEDPEDPEDPDADTVIELVDAIVPFLPDANKHLFINAANHGLERLLGPFGFRTVGGLQLDRLEYALGNFAVLKRERVQLRLDPSAARRHGIQTWPTAAELEAEGRLVAIRTLPDGSLHVGPLSEFRQATKQNRINHALEQLEAIRNSGPAALFGRIVGHEKGAAIGAMVDAGLMIGLPMKARQAVRTQISNMSSGDHVVTREPLDARLPIVERAQPRTPVQKSDLSTQTVKAPPATVEGGKVGTSGRTIGKYSNGSFLEVDPSATDPLGDLKSKHGISDQTIDALRASGAKPETVDALVAKGIEPEGAGRLVAKFSEKSAEVALSLTSKGVAPDQARAIAYRAGETGLTDAVATLADSPNFRSPEKLNNILNKIKKGDAGSAQSVRDAAERAKLGNDVKLDAGQGDVVDRTADETIQHKEINGESRKALFSDLQKGAKQIRGETGEVKPTKNGVVDARIVNEKNPFYDVDRAELSDVLRRTPGLDGVDLFKITNKRGTFEFKPPDFK